MARIRIGHNVKFKYSPNFIECYKGLPQWFKTWCEELGKPFGYSGMNVFYTFFLFYRWVKVNGLYDNGWVRKT